MGEGGVVGELMFIEYTPINYHGVNGLALASEGDTAQWELLALQGEGRFYA